MSVMLALKSWMWMTCHLLGMFPSDTHKEKEEKDQIHVLHGLFFWPYTCTSIRRVPL